jgi:hypothetical protein
MTQKLLQFDASERTRLRQQLEVVRRAMADGEWRTLDEIQVALPSLITLPSISARLRQLRNEAGYTIEKRLRKPHLYEYRLT